MKVQWETKVSFFFLGNFGLQKCAWLSYLVKICCGLNKRTQFHEEIRYWLIIRDFE